jgi:dTDP-4-dehydrorhamnose reductase
VLVELMEKRALGTLHAANGGACSWREFAGEICHQLGTPVAVDRISSAELQRPAPRPAWSVLDTGALE